MKKLVNLRKKRFLIIDDQKPFQVMLKGLLLSLGAGEVVTKTSGEAGIAAHQKHPFDILMVDYNLGRGKNGRQVLEELRARNLLKEDSLFFLITGDNTRPMVLSALELQPDDYLMKPFSHGTLRARLQRSHNKRETLKDVYQPLLKHEYYECIAACQKHIDEQGRYVNFCRKLQAEMYNKTEQYDKAETLLMELLSEHKQAWALLVLAETRMLQNRPYDALDIARKVARSTPNAIEAHDLLVRAYLAIEEYENALESARKAISLAPYSLERQSLLANVARQNGDFDLARQAMQHIVEITRKSVHRHPKHLLAYLRSILDAAEHGETRQQISRYQTEASLALQRARFDDNIVYSELSFDDIESVVSARIEAFNGRFREAQKHLNDVVGTQLANDEEISDELLPDIMCVLMDLGEYEKADEIAKRLQQAGGVDEYTERLLSARMNASQQRQNKFFECHHQGIKYYRNGNFGRALENFTEALKHAPMNSGAALNYIQAASRILGTSEEPNQQLVQECKRCFRILEGLSLTPSHQQRYDQLYEQCRRFGV
ncbi:response regulator [Idiomarina tyrosinivorans]|uniref:Response regulator n=1 Tax=Idiomarina tyrosinivorans TaxID=1445662 RepID=A0A432ZRX0_9GAMM|nr:tetratricopeptide repeat-containing response regulator [Idiomarina tyrosinivorans]RUO80576.1 response regulator [Idiomarina tyrosinivorans]